MELLKNTVPQYTLIADGAYGQEESLETIVPDVNPDVLRILCASAEICLKEKSLQAGKARAAGEIRSRIFYTAEGGETIWMVEGSTPFSCAADIAEAGPDDTLVASCSVVSAQASMLNPRKLSVKTRYCLRAQVYRQGVAEYVEGVDSKPEDGVHTLLETAQPLTLIGLPERRMVINEEIRLSGGSVLATDRLYRTDLSWVIEDKKVLTNKIMLRGSACVKVITLAEKGGAPSCQTYNLPFAQIIESDTTDAGDEVEVLYQTLQKEIGLTAGVDGAPVLQCSITAVAQAFVSRRIQVRLLTDLYSTVYDGEAEAAEISVPIGAERQSAAAAFSETIPTDAPAVRVYDVAVRCEVRRPAPEDMSAVGWVCCQILYETADGLCCAARKVEVEGRLESPYGNCCGLRLECAEPQVSCAEDGSLLLSGKGVFTCTRRESRAYRQIKSWRLNRQSCKVRPRRGTLVLRAYDGRDTVWQIAKKYNTTAGDILAANKISDESELSKGSLILIPYSR